MISNYTSLLDAVNKNDLTSVKLMVENGYEWSNKELYVIIIKDFVDILQYYFSIDSENRINEMKQSVIVYISYAAIYNCLNMIKYLHQLGFELFQSTVEMAAQYGHLDVLKYCINNGCQMTTNLTTTAAGYGKFDILKYCIENGCPYDEDYILTELEDNDDIINREVKDEIMNYIFSISSSMCKASNVFKQKQYLYQSNLDKKDRMVIKLYTGNTFFRAINATEQDLLDLSLLPEEEDWKKGVKEYCELIKYNFNTDNYILEEFILFIKVVSEHINRIIYNAPEITETTTIYRGVKTPYFVYDYKTNPDDYFVNKGFMSTTTVLKRACHYAENNYIMKGELKPGTKCLYYVVEKEIVLPLNTSIKIITKCENKNDGFKGVYKVEFNIQKD